MLLLSPRVQGFASMTELFSHHLDFLLFAAAVVAAFAALTWLLTRWRPGARLPRVTFVIVPVLLIGGVFLVESAGRAERRRIESLVSALAPTYALELARAGHAKITPETPAGDPTLQDIRLRIDEWLTANPIVADIYTMRRLPDGRRVFIVDTDTDTNRNGKIEEHETGAPPGEIFDEEDRGLDRALAGEANFNADVVEDRWGSWVGAWAPIRDPKGGVEAVVGIDLDARTWVSAISRARHERMLQLGLLLAVVAASMVAIGVLQASVAERRATQEKHAASEQRLRLTLDQMPLAFVEIDLAGTITGWNPAAETMFGYTREEVVGKMHYENIVAPEARRGVRELFATLAGQPLPLHNVNDNLTRDGRIIRCEWFHRQICGADGRMLSLICMAQDVSERQSLEEQVRQSQRMTAVGQLAAGIAHDFNNLLTVIQGHADLLRETPGMPKGAREDIERIFTAGDRAANLTRQLLTFSRKHAIFAQPVNLNATVLAITHLLERTLGATITVQADLAEDIPNIVVDSSMLEQAITNLALNARDAMPLGGTLTIRTQCAEVTLEQARTNPERRAGKFVKLTVSDTGTGIPPEVVSRIFEPFFTTKEIGRGTGLGLSAVHGIMKQHGGWIEVQSVQNLGTRFELFFPPTSEGTQETTRSRLTRISGGPKATVLLVEDEAGVRNIARIALERYGYRVLEAEDGPAAEQLWSNHRDQVSVLLTDMVMPNGISGRELADRLLTERPNLPVVFVSGYSVETTAPGFAESAKQAFLQKPYLPEQLITAVEQVLRDGQTPA